MAAAMDAAVALLKEPSTWAAAAAVVCVCVVLWMLVFAFGMWRQEVASMRTVNIVKAFTFSLTWMVLCFVASLPALALLAVGQRRRSRELVHYLGCKVAQLLQKICFQSSIIEGLENLPPKDEPVVFVANHQSTADISVFMAFELNYAWVSKATVFMVPGVGLLMRLAGYVSLQRGSKESSIKMMEDCRKCLAEGWSVVIFPQGTRRRLKVLDFKQGAFRLAQEAHVPIVPVTIELPENMYHFGCKEHPRLTVHKPIYPNDPLFEDKEKLRAACFDTVVNSLSYGPEMLRKQRDAAATAAAAAPAVTGAADTKKEK